MDAISIHDDFTFDSGLQPIVAGSAQQRICRFANRGRRCVASVTVVGGSIADFQVLQSAFPDDPNPQVVFDASGINSPALANESYVLPASVTYPFGPGTLQVHLQGDACELIFQASGAATSSGSPGVTVQVRGSLTRLSVM